MPDELLNLAVDVAREAGASLRENFRSEKKVDEFAEHDIKLELDVKTQDMITERLLGAHPGHAIYGEEGIAGTQGSDHEWIVDPIDGTVNFFFGIPHFCVSIGLRTKGELTHGVIYDPMMDEMWSVGPGESANVNGQEISVSPRAKLSESIMTIGFSKSKESIESGLKHYGELAMKVRKTRMLGSAALGMAYVATGRLDAYIEEVISLWDIAAGIQLVEGAGGKVKVIPRKDTPDKMRVVAWNGLLPLEELGVC